MKMTQHGVSISTGVLGRVTMKEYAFLPCIWFLDEWVDVSTATIFRGGGDTALRLHIETILPETESVMQDSPCPSWFFLGDSHNHLAVIAGRFPIVISPALELDRDIKLWRVDSFRTVRTEVTRNTKLCGLSLANKNSCHAFERRCWLRPVTSDELAIIPLNKAFW